MVLRPDGILRQPGAGPRARDVGPQHSVVQVRLFTAHSIITGTLRLGFTRLSDHLNFGPPVLELGHAELVRLGHAEAHRAQQVAYVRKEAIMLAMDRVAGDYSGTHPALREVKEWVTVKADLGHFIVSGHLHLSHGTDLADWLLDGRLFVPLTDVSVDSGHDEPMIGPLAIINRANLSAVLH